MDKKQQKKLRFSEMATSPEKLWFKAKSYGWGWYPATWQGWAIIAMYVFAIASKVLRIHTIHYTVKDWLMGFIPQTYVLTVFLIIICYATGEKPEWHWGSRKEETFDVLDEAGLKTGMTASRSDVHSKGLWHRASHVYVINDKNEVLLQRRAGQKSLRPGRWYISAGGHLRAGETAEEAALREVKEELGTHFEETALEHAGTAIKKHILLYGTYVNNEFDDIFVIHANMDMDKIKKNGRAFYNGEVAWFPLPEFKNFIQGGDTNFVDYEGLPVLFAYLDRKHAA